MASARFHIMARSGPEDTLRAEQSTTNSGPSVTSGADWTITRSSTTSTNDLYYKDFQEAEKYASIVEGSSSQSRIIRDLEKSRLICSQPRFAMELCAKSYRAHQIKQCTPAYVEHLKCGIKLTRAVNTLCKNQFESLATCLETNSNDASKCVPSLVAFDTCTEDF